MTRFRFSKFSAISDGLKKSAFLRWWPRHARTPSTTRGVISLLLLLGLCGRVLAAFDPQNPCGLAIPPPPVLYTDFLTSRNLCTPYPFLGVLDDTSTVPVFRTNQFGGVAYWYCKQMGGVPPVWLGGWNANFVAVTTAEASKPGYISSLGSALAAAAAASNPSAAFNAIAAARVNTPMNDPTIAAVWCPVWPAIWAGAPPDKPAPPPVGLHVAAPATFLLRSGVLTSLLSKATVGAACTCPTPAPVIGGKTYCTFTGAIAPTVVAECS